MSYQSDLALLAAGSYWDVRQDDRPETPQDESNRAPTPANYKVLTQYDDPGSGAGFGVGGSGFIARVYQNIATGEVVISYGGTEFNTSSFGLYADFLSGNIPLAVGTAGAQALEAAKLYQRVKADPTLSDNITFTGHSLGGGLASVMAVWFDRPAYVFAPAPFEKSADTTQSTGMLAQYRRVATKNIAACASKTRARGRFRKGCPLIAGMQHAHARTEVSQ